MIDSDIKLKQQSEWIESVTLTNEQVRKLISNKLERGNLYSPTLRKQIPQESAYECL